MSYIQQTLLPKEEILYHTKPHYVVFFPVFIWLSMIIACMHVSVIPVTFYYILLVLAIFSCIKAFITYYYSEYIITNMRLIMKVGCFRRRTLELLLNRVEVIYVNQGIFGRILNFGRITVGGIGGTQDPYQYVAKPIEFRNIVQQQIQIITTKNNQH
jgi:uncharacterized membrane protein YdbT with pleckstrin-like domain